MSKSGDGKGGCVAGNAKRRATSRVVVQPSAMMPDVQAEQHDPARLDPPLIANLVTEDVFLAISFETIRGALLTMCTTRAVGLVPT